MRPAHRSQRRSPRLRSSGDDRHRVVSADKWRGDTDLILWHDAFWLATVEQAEDSTPLVVIHQSADGQSWRRAAALPAVQHAALSRPRFVVVDEAVAMEIVSAKSTPDAAVEPSSAATLPRSARRDDGHWGDLQSTAAAPAPGTDVPDEAAANDYERRVVSDGREVLLIGRTGASAVLFTRESDADPWKRYDLSCALQWERPYDEGIAFAGFTAPNLFKTPEGIWLAAGGAPSASGDAATHTMVTWIDAEGGKMRRLHVLTESAVPGRVGLAYRDGRLFVSRVAPREGGPRVEIAALEVAERERLTVDVCRNGGAGSYDAFPDVTRLADGRLCCVFYAGHAHVSHRSEAWPLGGRIVACISADEGKTWSPPQTVVDGPLDDRDPSITQLADGRLLCVYFTYPNLQVYLVESSDAAASWSESQTIAPQGLAVSSPVRELRDGRLVLGLYDVKRRAGASVGSDDGGTTWSDPVAIDSAGAPLDAETGLIKRSDGSLYALQRGPVGTQAHYAVSLDRGESWSVSQPVGFEAQAP